MDVLATPGITTDRRKDVLNILKIVGLKNFSYLAVRFRLLTAKLMAWTLNLHNMVKMIYLLNCRDFQNAVSSPGL